MRSSVTAGLLLAIAGAIVPQPALAQATGNELPPAESAEAAPTPTYRPRLGLGLPAGTSGGATRSAAAPATPLPRIALFAPADHAGFTARPDPTLHFYVSRPVQWPMQLTISAPLQPAPVLDVPIPSPTAVGTYSLRLGDYGARLQPGITYTWSISILLHPRAWSRNIVASAPIVFDPTLALALPPTMAAAQRAASFAEIGLWYDAVAAAIEAQRGGINSAIVALLQQGNVKGIAPDS